jgi:hypothetical protein
MRPIDRLALGSVILGCLTSMANIAWLGFYWLYEGSISVRVEQLAPVLGLFLSLGVGLVGVALGVAALDRQGVRQGERRGRTLARVGIALGMLPLLLFCLHFSVLLS